jgi:hypothetical protein
MLYLCADGVAAFDGLYAARHLTPTAVFSRIMASAATGQHLPILKGPSGKS